MSAPSEAQLVKLGESLREIDPSTLQQDEESGPVRWFLGDSGTELFVWADERGRPQQVQLVFARVSVEWTRLEGLKTGSFSKTPASVGGRYDTYVMEEGHELDPLVCRAALTLMRASRVEHEFFSPFLEVLQQAASPAALAN